MFDISIKFLPSFSPAGVCAGNYTSTGLPVNLASKTPMLQANVTGESFEMGFLFVYCWLARTSFWRVYFSHNYQIGIFQIK